MTELPDFYALTVVTGYLYRLKETLYTIRHYALYLVSRRRQVADEYYAMI